MKFNAALCAILLMSSLTLTNPSYAHVTANPDAGLAGSYFQTSFRISHGCESSDTISIHIDIPPGFITLRPQNKPGWTVSIEKRKLDNPVDAGHGKMVNEEFSAVSWKGGVLPDSQYDEFGILVKLPEGDERTFYFPVTQTCVKGEQRWVEIPKAGQEWHELKTPAPFVHVTGKNSDHPHHSAH